MKRILTIIILAIMMGASASSYAQCAMCRASASSNMNNKQGPAEKKTIGAGLNTGILYLMSIPYVLGGLGYYIYYRNKKQIKAMFSGE